MWCKRNHCSFSLQRWDPIPAKGSWVHSLHRCTRWGGLLFAPLAPLFFLRSIPYCGEPKCKRPLEWIYLTTSCHEVYCLTAYSLNRHSIHWFFVGVVAGMGRSGCQMCTFWTQVTFFSMNLVIICSTHQCGPFACILVIMTLITLSFFFGFFWWAINCMILCMNSLTRVDGVGNYGDCASSKMWAYDYDGWETTVTVWRKG